MRVFLLLLFVLVGCNQDQSGVQSNLYTVKKNAGKKHSAVFQIRTQSGGGCTAFAISDKIAITAGHCVEISNTTLANKKDLILEAAGFVRDMSAALKEVDCTNPSITSRMPRFVCERELREMNRKVRSAADFLKRLKQDKPDEFKVVTSEGKELDIRPIAIDHENGFRDFAILSGDFSQFEQVSLVKDIDFSQGELLRTCGFANLKIPATCTNFVAQGNNGFAYAGNGYLVKGMSGGPVFNSKGQVVGINVAVSMDQVMITPVVGILNSSDKKD